MLRSRSITNTNILSPFVLSPSIMYHDRFVIDRYETKHNIQLCRLIFFQLVQEPCLDLNNIDISPIEPTLRNKLMPFQQQGVRYGS